LRQSRETGFNNGVGTRIASLTAKMGHWVID
jgi:hypothetical protein